MTTAFVLGGGGLLGAHEVGMLRALAEARVRPDLVVGTSAGSLVAAGLAVRIAHPGLRGAGAATSALLVLVETGATHAVGGCAARAMARGRARVGVGGFARGRTLGVATGFRNEGLHGEP